MVLGATGLLGVGTCLPGRVNFVTVNPVGKYTRYNVQFDQVMYLTLKCSEPDHRAVRRVDSACPDSVLYCRNPIPLENEVN